MRILLDARAVGKEFSGVGTYVLELVRAFAATDDDAEFWLCVHGPSDLRALHLDSRFHLLEAAFSHESHPLGDVWEQFVLPRRAKKLHIDVLHGPAFLVPTRRSSIRTVVTVHDLVAFTHPNTIPRKYGLYMRWLIRRAVRSADRVITVSASVRGEVMRLLGTAGAKIDHIAHGVSRHFAPRTPGEIEAVRHRYGVRSPYLLFVGNLEPRKNLPGLIEAYRRIRRRSQGVQLVVAGQLAWRSDAVVPALRASDVQDGLRLLGYVPAEDLPALYSGAAAFVFPSFWEGFGLPILEAMACGTPVVTSRAASIPEVAGSAAVLVDPASPESIAEGILRVLRDPRTREECRRLGLARAQEFAWERTARATLATYRKASAGARE